MEKDSAITNSSKIKLKSNPVKGGGISTLSANSAAPQPLKKPSAISKLMYKMKSNPIDIIEAAKEGDRNMVQKLLEKGAEVDVKDSSGWTHIFWASKKGPWAT